MIELKVKKPELSVTLKGQGKVTFEVPNSRLEEIQALNEDKDYVVEIKEYRKKRSLDANAYCWVLIGKLAEKLNIPPNEVYKEAIRNIYAYETVCIQKKALEWLKLSWERNGIGFQVQTFESRIKDCVNAKLFYGSSVYDTKQMSALIDNLVQECHEQKIQTMTPNELQSLVEQWGGN